MNTIRRLDFDEVCDLFVAAGAHNSPAEMHGLLVGELAAGRRMEPARWLEAAREFMDSDQEFTAEQQEQLQFIYLATLAALADENLGFYPLLANDDAPLEDRLETLAAWCQGFLAGFALVERRLGELPEEVSDALGDLAAISQIGMNDNEEFDASADDDFANILEYIRLAVMNIFLEYAEKSPAHAPAAEAEDGKPTLTAQSLFAQRQLH